MKTLLEWILSIEDNEIKINWLNAIKNEIEVNYPTADKELLSWGNEYDSLSEALMLSFDWSRTKQGHVYWDKIHSSCRVIITSDPLDPF